MDAALPPGPREPAALQTLEWVARPTAFLRRCAAAYGEAFTIRLAFDDAPLVLVWHPEAVRAVYAADPSVAQRGASPGPLRPVAGPRSILFADGAEHLRIRRLMLASFHGERIAAYRAMTHEVALEHVARWPRGRPVAALGLMQELTLDVILRAVFGTSDERLAADIRDTLRVARSLPRAAAMSLAQRDLGPRSPWGAFLRRMAVVDEQLMALIARRRAEGAGGDDMLAPAARRRARRRRAARPPGHPAGRRPRDDRGLAGLGARAPGPRARGLRARARRRRGVDRRRGQGDPAHPPGADRRPAQARRAAARRRPRAAGRGARGAVHLPRPPPRGPLPRRAHLAAASAGSGGARAPESFAWIPFGGGVRRCLGAAFATMEMAEVLRVVAERLDLAPADARGERMRRRGITLQPGRGARVVLSDASSASSS